MEEYINASLEPACLNNSWYQCRNKNYLYNRNYTWSLNGSYYEPTCVHYLSVRGSASHTEASNEYYIRPVVILKSTVQITAGDGSVNNPYLIKP